MIYNIVFSAAVTFFATFSLKADPTIASELHPILPLPDKSGADNSLIILHTLAQPLKGVSSISLTKSEALEKITDSESIKNSEDFLEAIQACYIIANSARSNQQARIAGKKILSFAKRNHQLTVKNQAKKIFLLLATKMVLKKDFSQETSDLIALQEELPDQMQATFKGILGYQLLESSSTQKKGLKYIAKAQGKAVPQSKAFWSYLLIKGLSSEATNVGTKIGIYKKYLPPLFADLEKNKNIIYRKPMTNWLFQRISIDLGWEQIHLLKNLNLSKLNKPLAIVIDERIYYRSMPRSAKKIVSLYYKSRETFDSETKEEIDIQIALILRAINPLSHQYGKYLLDSFRRLRKNSKSKIHKDSSHKFFKEKIVEYFQLRYQKYSASSSKKLRFETAKYGLQAMKLVTSKAENILISEKVAILQSSLGFHESAASTYMKLSALSKKPKNKYTMMAFRALQKATGWPADPPLAAGSHPIKGPKKKLLNLVKAIHKQDPRDLGMASHYATITASLGNLRKAAKVLAPAVLKKTSRSHSSYALALSRVTVWAEKARDWPMVIKLCRNALESGSIKTVIAKNQSYKTIMKNAHIQYGKYLEVRKKLPQATQQYELALANSNLEKEKTGLQMHLINLYIATNTMGKVNQHTTAFLKTNTDLLHRKKILDKTIKYSIDQKALDWAIALLKTVNKETIDHKQKISYWQTLAKVYQERGFFSDAIASHQKILRNAQTPQKLRTYSAVVAVDLERKYGDINNMEKALLELEKLRVTEPYAIRKAIKFRTQLHLQRNESAILKTHEKALYSLARKDNEARMILAGLLLLKAEEKEEKAPSELFPNTLGINHNGNLDNYSAAIEQYHRSFKQLRANFLKVCQLPNKLCAPARLKINYLADKVTDLIKKIQPPAYFKKPEIFALTEVRQAALKSIARMAAKDYSIVKRLVSNDNTYSEWRDEVRGYKPFYNQ